uniref:Methyltransferase domain-containing protein n=1 Tax=Laticauda laticaudata TaxID=8630 RepID=A0A8C5SF50_LATLA
ALLSTLPAQPPERPASNARYRERGFWDARYEQEGAEPTEWFGGLESFREQLEAELKPGDRILVLGCGNSALSYDLFRLGYTDITNIDYSAVCIASMRDRYAHCSGLHWAVMDARFLTFMDGSFDVVLEKGFLDSIMVEEKDLWNVSQEAKILLDQVLTEVSNGPSLKRIKVSCELDVLCRKQRCFEIRASCTLQYLKAWSHWPTDAKRMHKGHSRRSKIFSESICRWEWLNGCHRKSP